MRPKKQPYILNKIFLSVLPVMVIALFCGVVYAHEPSDANIDFNNTTKILKIHIHHPVQSTALKRHYIEKVQLMLNSKLAIEQTLSKQDDADGVELFYRLPEAAKGDALSIQAYSTIEGAKRFDFVLNKEEKPASPPASVVK